MVACSRSTGGLRRRPRRQPSAAGRRLPLPRAPPCASRRFSWGTPSCRWRSPRSRAQPVLTAGPVGGQRRRSRSNPSYFSPATFAALRAATGDGAWSSLAASSRSITSTLMPAPSRLPPDWARLEGDKPVPIGSPSNPQRAAAVRLRRRAHAGPDGRGSEPGGPADRRQGVARVRGPGPDQAAVEHDLYRTADRRHPASRRARGRGRGSRCRRTARPRETDCSTRPRRSIARSPTYYGAAWVALGRIMLTTRLLDGCS